MKEWIHFDNKLLKLSDVDSFELADDNQIFCNYHQGLSYLVAQEDFKNMDEAWERFEYLKYLLGIASNHSFNFSSSNFQSKNPL